MVSPLKDRTYRHLFLAQVVALSGRGLSTIALALLAYDLAGGDAGQVLGTALALKMIAYIGIGPVVGGLAHLLPRRRLLILLDAGRAATVLCLPFVTQIWQIYSLIFVLNAFSAGFTPTFQATIPDVLPDEAHYTRALALSRLAYDLENLLSPVLAAAALLLVSFDALFVLNAIAFLASALLVRSVTLPPARPAEREDGAWTNISFGIRAYLRTPRLRGLLALYIAVASAGAMIIVNTVVLVRDRFDGSESDTAIAFAAAGAGSIIIALSIARVLERMPERRLMLAGGTLLGTGLLLALFAKAWWAFLAIWFLLGAGSSLIQTPSGRLLRRSAQDADRAAIYAAQFALSHACWLLAYPLAGWSGSVLGTDWTFAILGLLALAAAAIAAILWPASAPRVLEHIHHEQDHLHTHMHDEHHQHEHEGWEGPEPHRHPHYHPPLRHTHTFVIDQHHWRWPSREG